MSVLSTWFKKEGEVNKIFLILILTLLAIGMIVLYSASAVDSFKNFGNTTYFFKHQLLYGVGIGLIVMYIASRFNYNRLAKLSPFLIGLSIILLILVHVPGLGFSSGGATRWLHFGPIIIQPAEIAKFSIVIYLATWFANNFSPKKNQERSIIFPLVITGIICALILTQPDLGSMLSLLGAGFVVLFLGGLSYKRLGVLIGSGVLALLVLIKLEPYRARRITTFFDRSIDPLGIGYHINQALLAIGSGGLWGSGYGQSRQKYNYLPEPIGDSVFAIMAEELGLFRALAVLGIFLALIITGISIASRAPNMLGRYIAGGIIGGIAVNVIINVSAIMGLLPLTGIPLPLFSYGSSSMIMTLASLGVVLNISRAKK